MEVACWLRGVAEVVLASGLGGCADRYASSREQSEPMVHSDGHAPRWGCSARRGQG